MANLNGFNASEIESTSNFEPLPAGKYLAVISDSEMKSTKSGSGSYLQLTFTVIEGEYKNRVLWARLNLNNPNATAVKIARSELSAVCRAVGVMQPRDSAELHNLPLTIGIKLKKRDDSGELTNVVVSYAKKEDAQGKPVQAVTNTPPWRRG